MKFSYSKSYFAPSLDKRTSLLKKFLVRRERTSYTWNEMTMERNDRIPSLYHYMFASERAMRNKMANFHCHNYLNSVFGLQVSWFAFCGTKTAILLFTLV